MYVLSKFAERYRAHSYVELVRRALGRKLSLLLSGVLVVAMFGACVAYLVGAGDGGCRRWWVQGVVGVGAGDGCWGWVQGMGVGDGC